MDNLSDLKHKLDLINQTIYGNKKNDNNFSSEKLLLYTFLIVFVLVVIYILFCRDPKQYIQYIPNQQLLTQQKQNFNNGYSQLLNYHKKIDYIDYPMVEEYY